ncbi:MAG: DMT family transporter [Candidatus Micrarchaeota archaeon]|nr:DMT family transporter [Candidatus Micrarchaeota archaeon]
MKIMYKGLLAICFVAVELAFMTVLMSVGGGSLGVLQFLFLTMLIAVAASLAISFASDRFTGLLKTLRSPKVLALMAVVGVLDIGVAQLLLTIGSVGSNPSVAGIVYRSWVIIMALLSPVLLRNRISRMQGAAIALGFVGIYIVAAHGSLVGISTAQLPYIAAVLGAALCVAIANLAIKRYNADTVGSVVVFNLASLGFAAVLLLATHQAASFQIPLPALAAAVFLGAVTYGVGNVAYMYSLKRLNHMMVGSITLAVPFLTVLLSFALLGTAIKLYYIGAAALIGGAIFLQSRASSRAPVRTTRSLMEQMQIFDITGAFINTKSEAIEEMVGGGNRALAIKLDEPYSSDDHSKVFEKHGCIAFTDRAPHEEVRKDEVEFIRDMLGVGEDQTALIGMGNPDRLETALNEFYSQRKGAGSAQLPS